MITTSTPQACRLRTSLRCTAAGAALFALLPSLVSAQENRTEAKLEETAVATAPLTEAGAARIALEEKDRTAQITTVIVTGRSRTKDHPVALPMTVLSGDELAHRRQGNLGETLAGLPGIHLDNFGGGASRPVIRGQTLPRIEILSDGANVFDAASVSPDHAIGTDPLLLDAIEIQRGPAAVRHGGNALNGAINLIDSKVPKAVPAGGVTGATEVRYGSGDGEKTVVGRVTAGAGAFAVHAEGSHRTSKDYAVPSAYGSDKLRDSFAENESYSAGASWITSKGYLGAAFTRQKNNYGLPGHSHAGGACHTHSLNLHCTPHGSITNPFDGIDESLPASIKLVSDRVDVRADYDRLVPGLEHVRLRLSHTDYTHDEIDGPVVFSHYKNKVKDGRVEATHQSILGFTGTFGIQYTNGLFSGLDYSDAHLYDSHLEFKTENTGIFLSERKSVGTLDFEVAVRKDWRRLAPVKTPYDEYFPDDKEMLSPEDYAFYKDVYNEAFAGDTPTSKVSPFSASIGATLNLDGGYTAGISLGRSQRAPGVRELYARNNNLATNSYEIGFARTRPFAPPFGNLLPPSNPNIIETAKSIDLSFAKKGGVLEFDIGLFYKSIDHYVYARLVDSEPKNLLLVYTPAEVRFRGIDGQISYRLNAQSRMTLFGDYVDADLTSANDNLPRVPPGRLGVRYAYADGPISADVDYSRTFAQGSFASYETRTEGYNGLNATFAYRLDIGASKNLEFYVRGTNLTNQLAFSHTSFVKNQSPLRGRNIAMGIRHQF